MPTSEIRAWLITKIADLVGVAREDVDVSEPFVNYGVSSRHAVMLSGELEDLTGRSLSPTLLYEYPTIESLSAHLGGERPGPDPVDTGATPGSEEPIAIVGIGCRFPGADGPAAFWELLRTGGDAIDQVPPDRWNASAFYDPDPQVPGRAVTRWGGFLDRIDGFDPFFFGVSPGEAERMDPQQRLLLELAYEALEDGGQVPGRLAGRPIGVFIGISGNEYTYLQLADTEGITGHSGTGNALSVAANRVSYFFDFRGPSLAVDTACSSSLMAVQLACRSIRSGESELALAGGINLMLSPALSIAFTKAGVMAPDGRCKPFDARADGYVRGEGGGLVVLKPLGRALADGDPIYATVRGSAVAQDGRSNGLMAPNRDAQEAVLLAAYRDARVSPAGVRFVEAHGTGTFLGDPIEAKALAAILSDGGRERDLVVGSVKSNIGHLEAAAGVAGLIKVALSLRHRAIPPSLHYREPNPHIPFEEYRLRVARELEPLAMETGPITAGVSSFGFGGTNVHAVLEEAPASATAARRKCFAPGARDAEREPCALLPVSAHTPAALEARIRAFRDALATDGIRNGATSFADFCYTAAVRRDHHVTRFAAVGRSGEEMIARLEEALASGALRPARPGGPGGDRPKTVFVFPGQGSQRPGMGRDLLEREPTFRRALEACEQAIGREVDWSLLEQLETGGASPRLDEIDVIQPAVFALQVALAALWRSWGIEPDAVVGHSMGEVAAAHVAGALTLEDAARVICRRSKLMRRLSGLGAMAVVELTPDRARRFVARYGDRLAVAAENSPSFTVLSGEPAAIEEAITELERQNRFCRPVNVDVASHSSQVDRIVGPIRQALERLDPREPALPMVSAVTGASVDGLRLDGGYWARNLREPVKFTAAVRQLLETGHTSFIEISAHPILLSSVRDGATHLGAEAICLPSLRRDVDERESMLEALCGLYMAGHAPHWERLYGDRVRCVSLPAYPWQRDRYWLDSESGRAARPRRAGPGERGARSLLGSPVELARSPGGWLWVNTIDGSLLPLLEDHRVAGETVFPASAFMVMAMEAVEQSGTADTHELAEIRLTEKLVLQGGTPRDVQTTLVPETDGALSLHVYSRPSSEPRSDWVLHATAELVPGRHDERREAEPHDAPDLHRENDLEAIRQRCTARLAPLDFYEAIRARGVEYGPRFRGIDGIWQGPGEALARLRPPAALGPQPIHDGIDPGLLDACLQIVVATENGSSSTPGMFLPVGCRRLRGPGGRVDPAWSHAVVRSDPESPGLLEADVFIMDGEGRTILEVLGFSLLPVAAPKPPVEPLPETWLYEMVWEPADSNERVGVRHLRDTSWLILADAGGVGHELAARIREAGARCELLEAAQLRDGRLAESRPGAGTAPPGRRLRAQLEAVGGALDGIVYLWSLDARLHPEGEAEELEAALATSAHAVLDLVQAVTATASVGSPRLLLVTSGAQPIDRQEVAVAQSPVWGLGRTIAFELPELTSVRIDLDPGSDRAANADFLWQQIVGPDGEDEVAVRDGVRFVPRVRACGLTDVRPIGELIGADRTYLITGGLGGLGLSVARWLAGHGASHLVLLGRTGPDPAIEEALSEIRRRGVEIRVVETDVADAERLEEQLRLAKQALPPLRGIVHAAGVLDDGALLNLDAARLARVMAPKVQGTWNLHRAAAGSELDFFVLFSSAVSVLGSPGQGNYAAASAFLDAMAHYRHQRALPAVSINWGPWGDVGLAAAAGERLREEGGDASHLVRVFHRNDGLRALEALVGQTRAQLMALPFDLANLIELHPAAARLPRFSAVVGREARHVSRLYARPALRHEYVEPRTNVERKLAELWRQALHIDRVGIHDSFFELGGDSVLAAQIVTRAQSTFGVRIDLEEAFNALTIERFAAMLEDRLVAKLDQMSEAEAERLLAGELPREGPATERLR